MAIGEQKAANDIKPGDTVTFTQFRVVREVTLRENGNVDVTFREGEPMTFDGDAEVTVEAE